MLQIKKTLALIAMFLLAFTNVGKTQCAVQTTQCSTPLPEPLPTLGLREAVLAALHLSDCRLAIDSLPVEGCYAPTEKILARTMMMDFLWELRNFTVDDNHPVANLDNAGRAKYDRYIGCIIAMIRTNASFINLAGKRYGGSSHFRYNDTYYCLIRQVVTDINAAYNCAGLQKPVVQGAVMEVVDLADSTVQICPYIIDKFRSEIVAAGLENEYFTRENNGTLLVARTDRFFNRANIVFNDNPATFPIHDPRRADGTRPNIMKVECQMFFYHCAKLQMDAGYTSLAMGFMKDWAEADIADGEPNTTKSVLDKIRSYAKDVKGQKMLITAEPGEGVKNYTTDADGTKRFLFDYSSVPLRPREIINPPNPPHDDPDGYPCSGPYAAEDVALFQTAPCLANQAIGAVFDQCILDAFNQHNNLEGYAPNGCFTKGLPYIMYFDYAEGEKWKMCLESEGGWSQADSILFPTFNGPGNAGPGTWGYADCNWLSQLSPACRAAWFKHTFCRIREMSNGNGFMQIPGLVYLPHKTLPTCTNTITPGDYERNSFFIDDVAVPNDPRHFDNGLLYSAAIEVTTVAATPPIIKQVDKYLVDEWCGRTSECNGQHARPGLVFEMKRYGYRFCVENRDCTSFYTWHIRKQDGAWLPIERGNCFDFNPAEQGVYIIGLRADNTGFPGTWGALLTPADVTITIGPECREIPMEQTDCWRFTANCPVRENDVMAYDFEITMDAKIRPADMRLTSTVGTLSGSAFDAASGRLTGKYKLSVDAPAKLFDVDMQYKPEIGMDYQTTHLVKQLDDCQQAVVNRDNYSTQRVPVNLRPNPSNDFFVIEGVESGTKYEILNSAGSTVSAGIFSIGDAVRVASYPPGLYFVKLISPTRAIIFTQKLVIAHKN